MNSILKHALTAKVVERAVLLSDTVWTGFSTMASQNKSPRLVKKIGTHSGTFHCDEAFACYMLKKLPEYKEAEIIRTRDTNVLDTCDIVVDVGGVYNPETNRYDHHQKEFEHTLSTVRPDLAKNKHIRLSSAGLVYAHFGLEVLTEVLKEENILPTTEELKSIYLYVYESFVEELDALDNGIPMYAEGKARYRINTHLGARVHRLNPDWNSIAGTDNNNLFSKAMDLTGQEFTEVVLFASKSWWPARAIVKKAIEQRKDFHESEQILLIDQHCPWKVHLSDLEEQLGIVGVIKFVIFHDGSGSWRVQGIPIQPDSFICRVFLHKDWRGVRDEKLSEIAGIEGCIFCHSTGFIGGNVTKEGALKMALYSLAAPLVDRE